MVDSDQQLPDFGILKSERAIKHVFDGETGTWTKTKIAVKMSKKPFARGTLRLAYYMAESDAPGQVLETEQQIPSETPIVSEKEQQVVSQKEPELVSEKEQPTASQIVCEKEQQIVSEKEPIGEEWVSTRS